MRRLLGAVVVVIGLGAPQLVRFLADGVPPLEPAEAPVLADSLRAPAPSGPPIRQSLPVRGVALRAHTPASFLADPFAFLSTAPPDSLDLLPGVGPVLASRIVAARGARGPFVSWNDVLTVRGIGPSTVERWSRLCDRR